MAHRFQMSLLFLDGGNIFARKLFGNKHMVRRSGSYPLITPIENKHNQKADHVINRVVYLAINLPTLPLIKYDSDPIPLNIDWQAREAHLATASQL